MLAGANGNFSAGNDIKELAKAGVERLRDGTATISRVFELMEEMAQVTIAALTGAALGSGLMLAARRDIRIADRTVSLGSRRSAPGPSAATASPGRSCRAVKPGCSP